MVEQLLIAGISGALIILYILGLGHLVAIWRARKGGESWRQAMVSVLHGSIYKWLTLSFAILLSSVILFGLVAGIAFG